MISKILKYLFLLLLFNVISQIYAVVSLHRVENVHFNETESLTRNIETFIEMQIF